MLLKDSTLGPAQSTTARLLSGRVHPTQPFSAQHFVCRLIVVFSLMAAFLVPDLQAAATNVYIAQNAAGAGNGADCADAQAASFFNNSANWGTGGSQIGPGTVVHLCGTITQVLSTQGSGSSGNVIEILFESGATISLPTCNGACLSINNNYILVDGGTNTPCGWNTGTNTSEGTCNGIIQETSNGSGLATQNADTGIYISNANNVEIRNLELLNIYLLMNGNFTNYPSVDPGAIKIINTSNLSIHDLRMSGTGQGITNEGHTSAVSNISIYNVDDADGATLFNGITYAAMSNIYIYGTRMHDGINYDSAPGCSEHLDGFYVFGPGSPVENLSNIYLYNNLFDGNWGQCITSRFYSDYSVNISGLYFFNNIFYPTNAFTLGGDGEIAPAANSGSSLYIVNNTFETPSGSTALACDGIYLNFTIVAVKNNAYQCGSSGFTEFYQAPPAGTADYNVYSTANGSEWLQSLNGGTALTFITSFATWQSETGNDAHGASTGSSLNLNATTYQPQTGSIAIGAGTNLYSVCNGQPNPGLGALCYDISGNARPTNGAWDAGAYSSGQSSAGAPAPPTGLVATVQ